MNSTFYLLRPFISLSVLPNEALKTKNIFLDCANVVVRSVIVSLCLGYFSSIAQAKDLTLDDLYNNFNIRSIYSSFGPRLKYYCENYLSDYFPEPVMISESEMTPAEPVTVILSEMGWVRCAKGHDIDPAGLSYKAGDKYLAHACGKSN